MRFLVPVMVLFTAVNASASITSSISDSVQASTERLKAFVAAHGSEVSQQVRLLADTAIGQAEQITALTIATAPKRPNARPVTLLCAGIGAAAGAGIGATGELGICFDLQGGQDIASHPGKYAYLLNIVGIGKVRGMSTANNLILISGAINENSTIAGHYIGAHGVATVGAGAFTKMEDNVDPRTGVDPMADKVFVHDVTFGIGASISLTADSLNLRKF